MRKNRLLFNLRTIRELYQWKIGPMPDTKTYKTALENLTYQYGIDKVKDLAIDHLQRALSDKIDQEFLFLNRMQEATAQYIQSEGCSCCQGNAHESDQEKLAMLLNVPKYKDGSGYNFFKFLPKKK